MSDIEWSETNEALRHRGLNPIAVPPGRTAAMHFHDAISSNVESDGEEREPKDVVVMEKKSLAAIQDTLHRLMADCDRRQGLITDLIKTNSSLRDELTTAKERRPSSAATERRPSSTTPIASLLRSRNEDSKLASFSSNKLNTISGGEKDENAAEEGNASSASRRASDDFIIGTNTNNNNKNTNKNQNIGKNNEIRSAKFPPTSTPTPTPTTIFLPGINRNPTADNIRAVVDGDTIGQVDSKAKQTDKELREIKRRLLDVEKEESRRRSRRDAVFKQIRSRPARSKNSADNRLLDVIDVYEREIDRITGERGMNGER